MPRKFETPILTRLSLEIFLQSDEFRKPDSAQRSETTFKLRGWWYEASWQDSLAAQAVAPLLQDRASEER